MSIDTVKPKDASGGRHADDTLTGREKLERLKARLFPPETKLERVAHAVEALKKAIKPSNLDIETLKYIAQHSDLEGF